MTATSFMRDRETALKAAQALYSLIERMRDEVVIPPPDQLRPATPADIVVGAVIYHRVNGADPYWHWIEEVQYPDDDFKAYVADDGCRYGLHEAFVEKAG